MKKNNSKTIIKIAATLLGFAAIFCLSIPCLAGSDDKEVNAIEIIATTTTSETTATTATTKVVTTTSSDTTTITMTTTSATTNSNIIIETTVATMSPETSIEKIEVQTEAIEILTEPQIEYVVFKPDTHYIHKSTCHWVDNTCYKVESTNDIECRKCSECNPNLEVINQYSEPTPEFATSEIGTNSYDRQLLAEIIWHEAGSDWISQYSKAQVAAGVMNRVNDTRFPSTVYEVLTQPGQFSGYWPGCCTPTQACYDAVDYYFTNALSFGNINSWYGDGTQNYFYYQ